MRTLFKIAGLLSLLLWWTAGQAQNISNKGKDFWVGYGHHQFMEQGSNSQQMTIYLSAEDQPATVTVTIDSSGLLPASWWRRTYTIPAFSVISIETTAATSSTATAGPIGAIPKGLPGQYDARLYTDAPPAGTGGAGLFRKKGIHIESNVPIVAYAHIYGSASSGATMLLPVEAWGYSYVSLNSNQEYASNCYNWMYVVAKENNTVVEITPSVKTRAQNLTGLLKGVTTQITLQKGQIYQVIGANVASDANGNGGTSSDGFQLTGTTVKSVNCKAIAVFAGSSRTSNPISCGSGGGDNDNQQLFPEHSWGKRYLTAPFSGTPATAYATSNYKIAVKDQNTKVYRNGVQLTNIQNGNFYEFTSNTADFIEADKPITVAQFMTGGNCIPGSWGDPEMVILSPIEQATKRTGFYRNNDESIQLNYLTLIVPNGGTGLSSLRIDNSTAFTHTYTHPVNPKYTVVIKQWPAAKAQSVVRSDSAFTAVTYGIGSVESYAYNAGAQLNDLRAIKHIRNIYDSVNTSNTFTCKNTPIKLSALISFQPTKLTWKLDTLNLPITPNTRIVQNNPTHVGTQVINGETYYRYELPGEYKFTQTGTFYIPIETEEPSAVCSRKDQMFLEIEVKAAPKADFTFTQTGCQSNVFNFASPTASGNGYTIKNWWWNFGDSGKDSVAQNPSHTYTADGTYNVQLSVISQEGCIGDTSKPVILSNVAIGASIVATPENVCVGGSITFTDTTSNQAGVTSWYWNFGNGQIVTLPSNTPQTITYNTPGQYEIKHVANKPNSGTCGADTIRKTITVYPKPAKPVVVRPVVYCQGTTAASLNATALAGHTLTWYLNFPLINGSATPITPTTATVGTYNYYVVQTSAEGCVSDTAKIEVVITPIVANNTISLNQTLCSGTAAAPLTGTTPTGGVTPYSYQWHASTDGGITWTDITNATSPTHSPGIVSTGTTKFRRVVNGGPCSSTSNVVDIVVQTNLTNYNITTPNQTICEGATPAILDGQTPGGAVGTPTYQWQASTDGTSWTVISGATAEDYTPGPLTVKTFFRRVATGGNCPAISNVITVTVNPTANGTITGPASICQVSSASITFTPTAGTAPYTIQLMITAPNGTTTTVNQTVPTNAPVAINVVPANSGAGIYSVALQSVADNGGCIRSSGFNPVNISVTATPSLVFNPVTPSICAGKTVALNVTGASTYTWSPAAGLSATTGASVVASPAATTQYTVTGSIAGCNGTGTVTVTVNNLPAKPVVSNPVLYCQNSIASPLAATALPGHTLTWYSALPLTGGSAAAPTPSTTTAGTYYYYVTQTNNTNCVSDTARVAVIVTAPITGNTISADQTVCAGTAAALLTGPGVGGGTSIYAYQWQQSTDGGATWANIAGATISTYNPGVLTNNSTQFRRVVTSGLCTSNSNAVTILVETSLANFQISGAQTVCAGSLPAQLIGEPPSGGSGNYSYQWSMSLDGTTWTNISGATDQNYQPTVLITNTYFRRTTSGGNCPAISTPVLITINPTANGSIAAPAGICTYQTADVTFTSSAGTAPYTIQLTVLAPGGGTSTVTQTVNTNSPASFNLLPLNSPAGTYSVQLASVTDSKGCSNTTGFTPVTIVVTAQPTIAINAANNPICEGSSTALTAAGATTYTWTPTAGLPISSGATVTANPVVTTIYQVTGVTNGCSNTASFNLTVIPRPVKPVAGTGVAYCQGATASQLTATALAGHTLTWYNNAALTGGSSTAPTPATATAGSFNYYVTQTNSNGCVSEAAIVTVSVTPLPTVNFDLPSGVCMPNGEAKFINRSSIPGNAALTYSWDFGDGSPTVTTKDASHVYAQANNYSVTLTVTSPAGCVATYSRPFSAFFEKPNAEFSVNTAILCQGKDNVFTDLSDPMGSTITKWNWLFDDGKTASVKNPTHRYTQPGGYVVKLVVTTAIGCVSDTFRYPVTVYPQPRIDAGPSFVVPEGTVVQFKAVAIDTTGASLSWTPPGGLSNATALQPTLRVTKNETYMLTAVGQGNCTATDQLTVRILKQIEVPNAFSPNGDGINDRWAIPNLADYPGAKVEVFNRWGQQIFLSYGYNSSWDGSYLGKPLPLATYYYVITLNNGFAPVTGSVTIIK